MAKLAIPIIDYANKTSVAKIPVPDAIGNPAITDLFDAVDDLVIGNLGQSALEKETPKNVGPGGKAANPDAQREYKWLCLFHDATTLQAYTLEIPCADFGLLMPGTETMNLASGAGLELKTQFDLLVKAPLTGNAVVLDEVQSVGRVL